MMYGTQSGPKTQLGTYNRNYHNFCFGSLANTSQCQPRPNKHPGLAAGLNVIKKKLSLRI